MKKLLVSLILCLFPVNLSALQVINGGSKTDRVLCKPALKKHLRAAKVDIEIFRRLYKRSTINKYLKQIRVCKSITLGDIPWAHGTYDLENKIIYMKSAGRSDLEYILHHEFSSIILKHPDNHVKYFNTLQSFLKISNSYKGISETHQSNWMDEDSSYQSRGFIVPYAQTSFENDFNMVASYLKTSYLGYNKKRAKRFKKLKTKFQLVGKFYRGL